MTMLQIQAMLDRASVREHNEYAAQAALHGRKMKAKSYDTLKVWEDLSKQSKKGEVNYDKMHEDMDQIMKERLK